MKSNTAVLLSVAVAFIGAIAISLLSISLDGAILFAAGAIISGFVIQFANSASKGGVSSQSSEDNFATTTLYVGNLPYRANEMAVRTLFADHGKVISVRLMKDKHTGKRRGFGFVEMPEKDAIKAISVLNEYEFQERSLKVREANERSPRQQETE